MKLWVWLPLSLVIVLLLLAACGNNEGPIRKTVEEVAKAAEAGLNRGNLVKVEPFFATADEGANTAGLGETWQALRTFADQLSGSDQVQFHSFTVQEVSVHESGGLARVTYRLHFSVVRNTLPIYSAVVIQNLALIQTSHGWRISGGDTPQVSDVTGQWPPR